MVNDDHNLYANPIEPGPTNNLVTVKVSAQNEIKLSCILMDHLVESRIV